MMQKRNKIKKNLNLLKFVVKIYNTFETNSKQN